MASFADKGQNAVHKAKVDKSESGALMRKTEIIGNNILDAINEAKVERREVFAVEGNIELTKDYIFGKIDVNPLQVVTDEMNSKIAIQTDKTDELVETYKFLNK